jgi:hypothetical protein
LYMMAKMTPMVVRARKASWTGMWKVDCATPSMTPRHKLAGGLEGKNLLAREMPKK